MISFSASQWNESHTLHVLLSSYQLPPCRSGLSSRTSPSAKPNTLSDTHTHISIMAYTAPCPSCLPHRLIVLQFVLSPPHPRHQLFCTRLINMEVGFARLVFIRRQTPRTLRRAVRAPACCCAWATLRGVKRSVQQATRDGARRCAPGRRGRPGESSGRAESCEDRAACRDACSRPNSGGSEDDIFAACSTEGGWFVAPPLCRGGASARGRQQQRSRHTECDARGRRGSAGRGAASSRWSSRVNTRSYLQGGQEAGASSLWRNRVVPWNDSKERAVELFRAYSYYNRTGVGSDKQGEEARRRSRSGVPIHK